MELLYTIGRTYISPDNSRFVLENVRGFIFEFKGGHWCTDNVFADYIDAETGIKVIENKQLELF